MDLLNPALEKREVLGKNALALAHVGDGVYELMVRTMLASSAVYSNAKQHRLTLGYVSAEAQAAAAAKLMPLLSEEEREFYQRGRNAHTGTVPKHAGPAVYHAATGLETLFGALWLLGRRERLEELFEVICKEEKETNEGKEDE